MRADLLKALLPIAALAAFFTASGCGGDGGANADPEAVLEQALGGTGGVDSGVLSIDLVVESEGEQDESVTASVGGPFQSNGAGRLPSIDFDAAIGLDSGGGGFDFDGGLTITPDGAFVGLDGTDYQLDEATFDLLTATYEQSAQGQEAQEAEGSQGSLQQFGIDPRTWITDLTNEGTEDLDGSDVTHISGSADVPRIVADLDDVAEQTGGGGELGLEELDALTSTVTDASIDVYAATEDNSFRGLDLALELADPRGGPGRVEVSLSVGLSDPGADQEITAPADALPLEGLLDQIPGGAAALGLGGDSGIGGGSLVPSGSAGPAAEDYYDCIAEAKDAAEIDACAARISE